MRRDPPGFLLDPPQGNPAFGLASSSIRFCTFERMEPSGLLISWAMPADSMLMRGKLFGLEDLLLQLGLGADVVRHEDAAGGLGARAEREGVQPDLVDSSAARSLHLGEAVLLPARIEDIFSATVSSRMSMSREVRGAPSTLPALQAEAPRKARLAFSTRSRLTMAIPARMESTIFSLYSFSSTVS